MSWGGIGGLSGEEARAEWQALQELLDGWQELGVITDGKVEWDPQEGEHHVAGKTGEDEDEKFYYSADEFFAFTSGLVSMQVFMKRRTT